ncbi:MAG: M23 family metallopeptidase [Spirochaetes bacterium]|nr:M23 family metallopeptidase [Spirochaetota bacterium]
MVARRLAVNYMELAKLNENRPLQSGSLIRFPGVNEMEALEGDSWGTLAAVLRVSERELRAANPAMGGALRKGDRIRLPGGALPGGVPQPRFVWPATGTVRAGFGPVDNIMNYGLTYTVTRKGVVAAEAGVVAFSGVLRGLGRTVMIAHGGSFVTLYAGLEETKLSAGQGIEKGRPVGSSGSSFFFSIFTSGSPQDPARLLAGGSER